jgi:predicted aspartyl protease/predicted negative regulator of RcsB-dependent stress response
MRKFVIAGLLLTVGFGAAQDMKEVPKEAPKPAPAAVATSVPAVPDDLTAAALLYRQGQFDAAIQKYQQFLTEKPTSSEAYAGLTRVYLKQKNVQLANETISKGLQAADGPAVQVALGEVYFRQGKIPEAEREWVNAINSGHLDARAYIGLARVDRALSLYKKAKDKVDKAHELDPNDPDIQRYWIDTLSRNERIKKLEEYLASVKNDDAKTRENIQHYIDYLKARQQGPPRSCKLIGNVTSTQTNLVPLLIDPKHMRGLGLSVSVNGTRSNLLLDTGATGILIDRGIAEKSGLNKLSGINISGIGDKGDNAGWIGLADSIKVGELEFQNCPVWVMDKRSVADEDGLIGADVFSSFLVDINLPERKLHLSPLPLRPGETSQAIKLKTDKDDTGSEQAENTDTGSSSKPAPPPAAGPFDAYVSPEMTAYTKVLRFGHQLLIPTKIGDAPPKLFMIDTGAFNNLIDPAAAREVTKVHGDSNTIVKGISGSVKNVYRADKAVLIFGNLKQENQEMVSLDMTSISDAIGTEISGALGFATLNMLDVKIDYRDGLVSLSYDPNRRY